MNNAVLSLKGLTRIFHQGPEDLHVLRGIDLNLYPGEIVALVGPSGSGKSTLLQTAGLLEKTDGGDIIIDGKNCSSLNDTARTQIRRDVLGFVYQFHHLLPEFDAEENIILPQMIAGKSYHDAKRRAHDLLTEVGLLERASHRPARLSGGEQQRIAIVRALANRPKVLLADEPTGNLDEHTAAAVFDKLIQLVRQENLAALIATHNMSLAQRMDRILTLHDGVLQ
ncbi:MAG: ABC transporter ATP-binding protein [Alphaproteobacteria bacterium]|jgi:lipoprotein-releasing system ATP-binding protein|nr:ABC transporter ATP-binding protein [Alphaproteobacteria bacterium]MBP9777079.1 ABC transporter ATP-binding protein [Alphaproteobacteria bacterium]